MPDINETLAQRGSSYGDFREQGRITQNLKRAMQDSPNWWKIPAYMREGLDMVQHKVSRILNGNPFYDDNFHDMVGYTKLMQDRAAQDVESGVTFEGGGDPMYPRYEHEGKGDHVTIGCISVPKSLVEPLQEATHEPADLTSLLVWEPEDHTMLTEHDAVRTDTLRRILALTDVPDAGKIAMIQNIVGD